jgi:hypothetical protein
MGGSQTAYLTPFPKNINFLPVLPEILQRVFLEALQVVPVEALPELEVFLHKPYDLLLS